MNTTTAPDSPLTPPHPARELLQRYSAIFSAAWAMRHQLAGPRALPTSWLFCPQR